jgi:hypothetical protein
MAHSDDGLMIIDIGDIERPELVGQLVAPGFARDLVLSGDMVYLADWTGGLRIIDVSTSTMPVELGAHEAFDAWRVVVDGDIAYVIEILPDTSWLHVLDVADPTQIVELATFELGWLPWALIKYGDYLYLNESDDLDLFSIADLANPILLDVHRLPDMIGQVTARGKYAFVCNGRAGLQVVENLLYEETAVEEVLPERNFLAQNQPNPFNPQTEITFQLAELTNVTLSVFDTHGRLVVQPLVVAPLQAGPHVAIWNGRDSSGRRAASGVYIYRLETPTHTEAKRMLLLK